MSNRALELLGAGIPQDYDGLLSYTLSLHDCLADQIEKPNIKSPVYLLLRKQILADMEEINAKDEKIEKLEARLAALLRDKYGRSSEKLNSNRDEIEQTGPEPDNSGKDQEESPKQQTACVLEVPSVPPLPANKPKRNPIPDNFPRDPIDLKAPCTCAFCGGPNLKPMPPDKSEVLHHVREHWRVKVYVRQKMTCKDCFTVTEAPTPSLPIPKGKASAGTLAKVLTDKFCNSLPLYRQRAIYAREGLKLSTSTLSGWVLACASRLKPVAEAIHRYIKEGTTFYADDTPMPVLDPGRGKTKTGRFWTQVRDERSFGSSAPRAAYYRYSPDRKSEHAQALLKGCKGYLHADQYAGFNLLYEINQVTGEAELKEVSCWSHARRKFVIVYEQTKSPFAQSILEQIGELFAIEQNINGQPPDRRKRAREELSIPILNALKTQLKAKFKEISRKSELAKAIHYLLVRWESFVRYTTDGQLDMTNNTAERAIRPLALGRKNSLFAGSDDGGHAAATIYTIIETCKMNDVDPYAYLCDTLTCIAEKGYPDNIDELLPWNFYNRASPPIYLH